MSDRRIIVIGDVHGCIDELDELLKKVQHEPHDRLVFLGDFMDRGPDPIGCIRRARELRAESTFSNHEEKHLRWRRHEDRCRETGKKNPMKHLDQKSRLDNEALSYDDISWIRSLPLTIDLGNNWVAVHGGFRPGIPISAQKPDDVIRMRFVDKGTGKPVPMDEDFMEPPDSIFWAYVWTGPENVIYGHAVHGETPLHTVRKIDLDFESLRDDHPAEIHTLGIDTGACFGGYLSACITVDGFKSWDIAQVKAKRVYREISGGVRSMGGCPPR